MYAPRSTTVLVSCHFCPSLQYVTLMHLQRHGLDDALLCCLRLFTVRANNGPVRTTRGVVSFIFSALSEKVCLPRYFCIKYPDFHPRFTLLYRSAPSRPEWTANLAHKAQQHKANQLNSTSIHVTSDVPNKQYYPHKCGYQYMLHNNAPHSPQCDCGTLVTTQTHTYASSSPSSCVAAELLLSVQT